MIETSILLGFVFSGTHCIGLYIYHSHHVQQTAMCLLFIIVIIFICIFWREINLVNKVKVVCYRQQEVHILWWLVKYGWAMDVASPDPMCYAYYKITGKFSFLILSLYFCLSPSLPLSLCPSVFLPPFPFSFLLYQHLYHQHLHIVDRQDLCCLFTL